MKLRSMEKGMRMVSKSITIYYSIIFTSNVKKYSVVGVSKVDHLLTFY